MKSFRPASVRSLIDGLSALFWTSVVLIVAGAMIYLPLWIDGLEHPKRALPEPVQKLLILVALTASVGFVGFLTIQQILSSLCARYEVGATEMTVQGGFLWRHRRSIPLAGILRIDVHSGPVSRLFGLSDLRIVKPDSHPRGGESTVAVLAGLENGEAVRQFLLDRREQLQEAALLGEWSGVRTPEELQLVRLVSAIERLERRLAR